MIVFQHRDSLLIALSAKFGSVHNVGRWTSAKHGGLYESLQVLSTAAAGGPSRRLLARAGHLLLTAAEAGEGLSYRLRLAERPGVDKRGYKTPLTETDHQIPRLCHLLRATSPQRTMLRPTSSHHRQSTGRISFSRTGSAAVRLCQRQRLSVSGSRCSLPGPPCSLTGGAARMLQS